MTPLLQWIRRPANAGHGVRSPPPGRQAGERGVGKRQAQARPERKRAQMRRMASILHIALGSAIPVQRPGRAIGGAAEQIGANGLWQSGIVDDQRDEGARPPRRYKSPARADLRLTSMPPA